jgi:hypothetical protein
MKAKVRKSPKKKIWETTRTRVMRMVTSSRIPETAQQESETVERSV